MRPVNVNFLTHGVVSDLSDVGDYDSDATTPQQSLFTIANPSLLRGESLNEYEIKDVVYTTLEHFFDLKNDEHLDDKIVYIAECLFPTFGTNETEDISPERRNRREVAVRYLMGKNMKMDLLPCHRQKQTVFYHS